MADITKIVLRKPYLLLVGDEQDPHYTKTGLGIVHWRREAVAGQLRFSDAAVDLGVPDLDLESAVANGVGSLIIGVATIGGKVPDSWTAVMYEAAAAGIDIVSGMHTKLADDPAMVAAAKTSGARLVDVRTPPKNLPVGTGKKRSGMRILTVGTDCAIGKKYTALALDAALREAGMNSTYRATGQTGIIIAGEGMPIDAVVADFVSGAAEVLSPANKPDHWDVIEGQGSLFHPGYAAVSMGLLHGSQPDGFVVCHDAVRKAVDGWEHFPLPELDETIDLHQRVARRTNPLTRCVGISVNTSALPTDLRASYLETLREKHGVPAVDPLIDGCADVVAFIRKTLA
ncbi:MAG: DUF1611 domain-containing protein [Woeseiaceae bacterium]